MQRTFSLMYWSRQLKKNAGKVDERLIASFDLSPSFEHMEFIIERSPL